MQIQNTDLAFAGSIPELYDRYMVPLIFEPYATDLAKRVASLDPSRVLEVAAGTGVVTRHLAALLPASTSIIATDLNQPMLDHAAARGTVRHVEWRQADAMKLPFADGEFDVVVCQFGVMFFPDKAAAYREARRVLAPGGTFVFNVWDAIEANELADVVTKALALEFPDDPPRFMDRVPHGYHARAAIAQDLLQGGFDRAPAFDTVAARSRADSSHGAAIAYCQGTPLRAEIEARDASRMAEVTERAAEAIASRFGKGRVDAGIQAHVVSVLR
ncbi:MAG: class I SAM-dependent methyltransferase [Burkholderiaceae bacterium]